MKSEISKDQCPNMVPTRDDADISFVIPHKGREELLLATLQSIAQLNISGYRCEVIVASQNVSHSDELARWHSTAVDVQFLSIPESKPVSYSRNMGAKAARGKYLAFLDADIALDTNWFVELLALLKDGNYKLVSAVQRNSATPTVLEKLRTALASGVKDCEVQFVGGGNLFLLKETFNQVGGFPEHLATCEDYVFTNKVSELGKLFVTSRTSFIHLGEDKTFNELFKKEQWRALSNLRSIGNRKIPLREWPSFIVPPAIPMLTLFALLFTLNGFPTLAVLSLLCALAPVLAYSLRLKRLVGQSVSLWHCVLFYLVYFPARAIGTLKGAFTPVATRSHV